MLSSLTLSELQDGCANHNVKAKACKGIIADASLLHGDDCTKESRTCTLDFHAQIDDESNDKQRGFS